MAKRSKTSRQIASLCVKWALDKKAFNVVFLDVRPWQGLNDYIVVCSAQSITHAQTIADHLIKSLKEKGIYNLGLEGYQQGKWILLDFNDVVVHIFFEYVREFYDIEGLWHAAPRIKIPKSYFQSYGKK